MSKPNPEAAPFLYLGPALKALRKRAGMTLGDLRSATGSAESSVSRYESGSTRPSLDTLDRLLVALGSTNADLAEEMERQRVAVEGGAPRSLILPSADSSYREVILAAYMNAAKRGEEESWLDKMDALVAEARRIHERAVEQEAEEQEIRGRRRKPKNGTDDTKSEPH